jgi:hypothetical protein
MVRNIALALGIVALVVTSATPAAAKPTSAQKCAAGVRKCCGKLFAGIVGCHVRGALNATDATDQRCVDKAKGKYDACTSKALDKGGCTIDGDGTSHLKDEIENSWAADVKADTPNQ